MTSTIFINRFLKESITTNEFFNQCWTLSMCSTLPVTTCLHCSTSCCLLPLLTCADSWWTRLFHLYQCQAFQCWAVSVHLSIWLLHLIDQLRNPILLLQDHEVRKICWLCWRIFLCLLILLSYSMLKKLALLKPPKKLHGSSIQLVNLLILILLKSWFSLFFSKLIPLEQISFHLGNLFEVEVPCSNHLEDILEVEIEDTDLS